MVKKYTKKNIKKKFNKKKKKWGERKTQRAIKQRIKGVLKPVLQDFENRVDILEKENQQLFQVYECKYPPYYQLKPWVDNNGNNGNSPTALTWYDSYSDFNPSISPWFTSSISKDRGYTAFQLLGARVHVPNYDINNKKTVNNVESTISMDVLPNLVDSQQAYMTKFNIEYKTYVIACMKYKPMSNVDDITQFNLNIEKQQIYETPLKIRRFVISTDLPYNSASDSDISTMSNVFNQLPAYNQSFASAKRRALMRNKRNTSTIPYKVIRDDKLTYNWKTYNNSTLSIADPDVIPANQNIKQVSKNKTIRYICLHEKLNIPQIKGGTKLTFAGNKGYYYDQRDPLPANNSANIIPDNVHYWVVIKFEDQKYTQEFCNIIDDVDWTGDDSQTGGFVPFIKMRNVCYIKVAT